MSIYLEKAKEWLDNPKLDNSIRNELNDALYQNLEKVIRKHIDLMTEGFTMKAYDSLHIDYRTSVMKALSAKYTFTTLEQFKTEFDNEVSKAKASEEAAKKKP